MGLFKRFFHYLGLDDECFRFLTVGLANNWLFFLYACLVCGFAPSRETTYTLLGKVVVVVFSTLFFSKIFKRAGPLFQQKILNKSCWMAGFAYTLILLEWLFTLSLKKGVIALFVLDFCFLTCIAFHFEGCLIFKILILSLNHLLFFYILFRTLLTEKSFKRFHCLHPFLYNYVKVYIVLQGEKIALNRAFLLSLLLLVTCCNSKYLFFCKTGFGH